MEDIIAPVDGARDVEMDVTSEGVDVLEIESSVAVEGAKASDPLTPDIRTNSKRKIQRILGTGTLSNSLVKQSASSRANITGVGNSGLQLQGVQFITANAERNISSIGIVNLEPGLPIGSLDVVISGLKVPPSAVPLASANAPPASKQPNSNAAPDNDTSRSTALIIGLSFGGVFIIATTLAAFAFFLRRRRSKSKHSKPKTAKPPHFYSPSGVAPLQTAEMSMSFPPASSSTTDAASPPLSPSWAIEIETPYRVTSLLSVDSDPRRRETLASVEESIGDESGVGRPVSTMSTTTGMTRYTSNASVATTTTGMTRYTSNASVATSTSYRFS
ncbi:hypothetical protein HDU97_007367 [Phlyctochytrium planicorne]|nr:hypothetical protein HDU97_007367 [Phlyctochytrium planicorne]